MGLSYVREDKRQRVEEVLQHWNPTNLSGQLLLLIMYAIFMRATFPMLAAWSGACSGRQRFWAVFFQLTGLCSLLQEQLQIPRHTIDEKQQKRRLVPACCLPNVHLSSLCTYMFSFMEGSLHLYKLNAEHTWHGHEYGNVAHRHICAHSCQDKYRVVSCCYSVHRTPIKRQ